MIDPHIITELEKNLEQEKLRVETELSSIATKNPAKKDSWNATYPAGEDDVSASSGAIEEMGDEIEEYDTRLSEKDTLEKRIHEINEALGRIEKGTFGTCVICKKEIPLERLRANPAAATDIEHAEGR